MGEPMANMKLRRLKIDRYRNVAPGTELIFNDTWNVLLGQNGTGKTTLLNLIAMIVASDFSPLKDEAFGFEYELTYPDHGSVVARLENRLNDKALEQPTGAFENVIGGAVELSSSQGESPSWSCRVVIRLNGAPAWWEISSSPLAAWKTTFSATTSNKPVRIVSPFEGMFLERILELLRWDDFTDDLMRTWGAVRRAHGITRSNAARFDESLGIFNAVTGIQTMGGRNEVQPSQYTVEVRNYASPRHAVYMGSKSGIVPLSVLEHILDEALMRKLPRVVEESGSKGADFMKKTASVLGFSSVELTWDLLQKEVGPNSERHTFGNFGFKLTLDDGSIINHSLLSYGQKRMLAFFYYLAANPDIVITDELVNGLHYDWIEVCLNEIGERQSFLTSQNPLLLDFLPFASVEDVQRSFLLCRREKHEGKYQLVWTNLDAESALSFFRAYETEAQQVSEILRSKGLW